MKRFMVLGIGSAQLDLIAALKGHFHIVACSNTSEGPAYNHVDAFELIDITDREKVLKAAKKHEADYIYSVGSDVAMPTVSWVSEALRLPRFLNYEASLLYSNKGIFREALKGTYGAVPFEIMGSANQGLEVIDYPAIIKPVDSQGQRGVQRIDSPLELEKAYTDALPYSKTGKVIAEEYVKGVEVSVNAFVSKGVVVFSIVSDRVSWPGHGGGIIHKHVLPSSISTLAADNVNRMVDGVAAALGVNDGPLYFQVKVYNDEPHLIEVAARLDGCHMWRLIKFSTGVDLLDMCIKTLTSGEDCCPLSDWTVNPAELEFFCLPPGEVLNFDFKIHENAVFHQMYYEKGDRVKKMNGYKEKCGYQIYEA